MMRAVPYFMAMAVLSVALPALAQVQRLPSAPGFPKYIEWPAHQNFPSVWTDSTRNQCVDRNYEHRVAYTRFFSDWVHPNGLRMSAMLTREGLEISSTEPLTMQYQWSLAGYPDVYGDYVAVDLVDCLDPFSCAYANPRVYSFDVINRRVYDLSGSAGGRRPSNGGRFVAWELRGRIAYNTVDGDPSTLRFASISGTAEFPSVWEKYIVFDEFSGSGMGIGLYDISSGQHMSFTSSQAPYRFAPHIAEGRIVYHIRDARNSSATYSELRYMDLDSLGVDQIPSFVRGLSCTKMSGPRVGGKEGRYILFTGVGCKGLPAISLLLGDEVSGKVYFVDELSYEMDTNDHRVPYDIHENVVVYVKDWLPHYRDWGRDYQAIVVYEFDESQM